MSASEVAQTARVEAAAGNLTFLAIGILLPILGIVLGVVKRRREKGERFRLFPFVISAAIGFVALVSYVGRDRNTLSKTDHLATEASEAEIDVNSAPLPAGSLLVPTTATKAREASEALRSEGQNLLRESGHAEETVTVTVFDVSANGKVVTRATSSTWRGVFSERAEGILNEQLVTITCYPKDPSTYRFSGSPCHRKMEKTFGAFRRVGSVS